jgi:hypothetical protein
VYQFKWELDQLLDLYPDAGVLGDGVSKTQAMATADAWNAGRLNALLVHPASAGHGLNFQTGGKRVVFMGPIWSRDQTDQVIARIRRRGCRHEFVEVIYLVARDTVEDCVVLPRVAAKGEDAASFREYLDQFR